MNGKEKLQEKIKTTSVVVSLLVTIGGVVIGLFNFATLSQLAPISARIDKVEANTIVVASQLKDYKSDQARILEELATKTQVQDLINRVDKISGRVDLLVNKLIK